MVPASGLADVSIALHGRSAPPPSEDEAVWHLSPDRDERGRPGLIAARRAGDGAYWLRYAEGAAFCVDARGGRVDAWWEPPLTAADAVTYLLGPVLAFVLRLKGRVPLHASAVVVRERALLFVGDAGAGKSTTAAAFATLGHAVLSDDIVPVMETTRGPLACPAYPRLSLWADSASALLGEPTLPSYSETYDKGYLDLEPAGLVFHSVPVPVEAIFVLEPLAPGSAAPAVRAIGARDRLMTLVGNSYGSYLLDARLRAAEFDSLSRLAAQVPVAGLALGRDLGRVRAACAALAAQLAPAPHFA